MTRRYIDTIINLPPKGDRPGLFKLYLIANANFKEANFVPSMVSKKVLATSLFCLYSDDRNLTNKKYSLEDNNA